MGRACLDGSRPAWARPFDVRAADACCTLQACVQGSDEAYSTFYAFRRSSPVLWSPCPSHRALSFPFIFLPLISFPLRVPPSFLLFSSPSLFPSLTPFSIHFAVRAPISLWADVRCVQYEWKRYCTSRPRWEVPGGPSLLFFLVFLLEASNPNKTHFLSK